MYTYDLKNFRLMHGGKEYLIYGKANYIIETDAETGAEAVFESCNIIDAIGFNGLITDRKLLSPMEDSLMSSLNNNEFLSRTLGSK